MIGSLLWTITSFGLLFLGAELLVRGGASLAIRIGLNALVVGLTVVAYGTSSPELVVSIKAAMAGQSGIAVGNVVGSNIFNIAVILGLAAVIRPIRVKSDVLRRDGPVMVAVTLVGMAVLMDGRVSRIEGLLLVTASLGYTIWVVRAARRERGLCAEAPPDLSARSAGLLIALGLALLIVGSRLLVEHSVLIARELGVSEAVIGLTIIAAGTSMPELATSAVGALRGQGDLALGNVVGSNIFNILFVLGVAASVHPISASPIRVVDQIYLLGFALVLMPLMWTGRTVGRKEGLMLLLAYGSYLWLMWPSS